MSAKQQRKVQRLLGQATAAMAGLAAAGAAPQATAAIVYTDLTAAPVTVFDNDPNDDDDASASFDIDANGVLDVALSHTRSTSSPPSATVDGMNGTAIGAYYVNPPIDKSLQAAHLAAGESIMDSFGLKFSEDALAMSSTTDTYLGLRLPDNHYGWMQVTVADVSEPGLMRITVTGYAYETIAGLPVNAGSQVSVPEPTALGAGLMVLAAGLLPRRRRPVPAQL